ncbi:MAG: hypothetical protein H0X26_08130 [Alphaproteobacteria bacterium]|nr:hypothetical protein [Alphaproteobacteria bacterium]
MKNFVFLFACLLIAQSPASAMLSTLRQEENIETIRAVQQKINAVQQGINKKVCASASNTYQKINNNWNYVAPNDKMSIDSPFWEAKWIVAETLVSGVKQRTSAPTLILKTSPDTIVEALEDLINKPAALECTIALTTAKIFSMKEILDELGEDIFKGYTTHFYQMLRKTKGWTTDQFFHELPEQFLRTRGGKEIPGSICYITNLGCYRDFKPTGNAAGSNVFCTGENQYMGFSGIYKNGPKSLEIIEKQDLELFCSLKDVQKNPEEHQAMCQKLKETEGLFETLRRAEQAEYCNFHIIFDAKKFIQFQNTWEIIL